VKLRLLDQQKAVRKDVEIIPVQPNLELVVYWKTLEIGKGPALILQAHGKEILKFDCFGKDDGHFHAAPEFQKKIFFEEETASGQIEHTVRELKEKAQFYLEKQGEDHIRKVKINQENLCAAVVQAKKKMLNFLEDVPELKDLR
jgi:hypothetical protein